MRKQQKMKHVSSEKDLIAKLERIEEKTHLSDKKFSPIEQNNLSQVPFSKKSSSSFHISPKKKK